MTLTKQQRERLEQLEQHKAQRQTRKRQGGGVEASSYSSSMSCSSASSIQSSLSTTEVVDAALATNAPRPHQDPDTSSLTMDNAMGDLSSPPPPPPPPPPPRRKMASSSKARISEPDIEENARDNIAHAMESPIRPISTSASLPDISTTELDGGNVTLVASEPVLTPKRHHMEAAFSAKEINRKKAQRAREQNSLDDASSVSSSSSSSTCSDILTDEKSNHSSETLRQGSLRRQQPFPSTAGYALDSSDDSTAISLPDRSVPPSAKRIHRMRAQNRALLETARRRMGEALGRDAPPSPSPPSPRPALSASSSGVCMEEDHKPSSQTDGTTEMSDGTAHVEEDTPPHLSHSRDNHSQPRKLTIEEMAKQLHREAETLKSIRRHRRPEEIARDEDEDEYKNRSACESSRALPEQGEEVESREPDEDRDGPPLDEPYKRQETEFKGDINMPSRGILDGTCTKDRRIFAPLHIELQVRRIELLEGSLMRLGDDFSNRECQLRKEFSNRECQLRNDFESQLQKQLLESRKDAEQAQDDARVVRERYDALENESKVLEERSRLHVDIARGRIQELEIENEQLDKENFQLGQHNIHLNLVNQEQEEVILILEQEMGQLKNSNAELDEQRLVLADVAEERQAARYELLERLEEAKARESVLSQRLEHYNDKPSKTPQSPGGSTVSNDIVHHHDEPKSKTQSSSDDPTSSRPVSEEESLKKDNKLKTVGLAEVIRACQLRGVLDQVLAEIKMGKTKGKHDFDIAEYFHRLESKASLKTHESFDSANSTNFGRLYRESESRDSEVSDIQLQLEELQKELESIQVDKLHLIGSGSSDTCSTNTEFYNHDIKVSRLERSEEVVSLSSHIQPQQSPCKSNSDDQQEDESSPVPSEKLPYHLERNPYSSDSSQMDTCDQVLRDRQAPVKVNAISESRSPHVNDKDEEEYSRPHGILVEGEEIEVTRTKSEESRLQASESEEKAANSPEILANMNAPPAADQYETGDSASKTEAELEAARYELKNLRDELVDLKQIARDLDAERDYLSDEREEMTNKLDAQSKALHDAEDKLQHTEAREAALRRDLEQSQQKAHSIEAELVEAEGRIKESELLICVQGSNIESSLEQIAATHGEIADLRELNKNLHEKCRELSSERESLMVQALEEADTVTRLQLDLEEAGRREDHSQKERDTMLIKATQQEKITEKLRADLNDAVVQAGLMRKSREAMIIQTRVNAKKIESLENTAKEQDLKFKELVSTLNGSLNEEGLLRKSREAMIIQVRVESKKVGILEQAVANLEKNEGVLSKGNEALVTRISQQEESLKKNREALAEAASREFTLKRELAEFRGEEGKTRVKVRALEGEISVAKAEAKELRSDVELLVEEKRLLLLQNDAAVQDAEGKAQNISLMERQLVEAQEQEVQLLRALENASCAHLNFESAIENLKADVKLLNEEVERVSQQRDASHHELEQKDKKIALIERENMMSKNEVASAHDDLNMASQRILEVEKSLFDQNEESETAREMIRMLGWELTTIREVSRRNILRLETELNECLSRESLLGREIEKTMGFVAKAKRDLKDSAECTEDLEDSLSLSRKELETARALIRMLGFEIAQLQQSIQDLKDEKEGAGKEQERLQKQVDHLRSTLCKVHFVYKQQLSEVKRRENDLRRLLDQSEEKTTVERKFFVKSGQRNAGMEEKSKFVDGSSGCFAGNSMAMTPNSVVGLLDSVVNASSVPSMHERRKEPQNYWKMNLQALRQDILKSLSKGELDPNMTLKPIDLLVVEIAKLRTKCGELQAQHKQSIEERHLYQQRMKKLERELEEAVKIEAQSAKEFRVVTESTQTKKETGTTELRECVSTQNSYLHTAQQCIATLGQKIEEIGELNKHLAWGKQKQSLQLENVQRQLEEAMVRKSVGQKMLGKEMGPKKPTVTLKLVENELSFSLVPPQIDSFFGALLEKNMRANEAPLHLGSAVPEDFFKDISMFENQADACVRKKLGFRYVLNKLLPPQANLGGSENDVASSTNLFDLELRIGNKARTKEDLKAVFESISCFNAPSSRQAIAPGRYNDGSILKELKGGQAHDDICNPQKPDGTSLALVNVLQGKKDELKTERSRREGKHKSHEDLLTESEANSQRALALTATLAGELSKAKAETFAAQEESSRLLKELESSRGGACALLTEKQELEARYKSLENENLMAIEVRGALEKRLGALEGKLTEEKTLVEQQLSDTEIHLSALIAEVEEAKEAIGSSLCKAQACLNTIETGLEQDPNLKNALDENGSLRGQVFRIDGALQLILDRKAILQKHLSETIEEKEKMSSTVIRLEEQCSQLESEKSEVEGLCDSLKGQHEVLQARALMLEDQVETVQQRLADAEDHRSAIQSEECEVKANLSDSVDRYEAMLSVLEGEKTNIQKELSDIIEEKEKMSSSVVQLEGQCSLLESEKGEMQELCDCLKEQHQVLQERTLVLEDQVKTMQQQQADAEYHQSAIQTKECEVNANLSDSVDRLEAKLSVLEGEKANLQQLCHSLADKLEQAGNKRIALQDQVVLLENNIRLGVARECIVKDKLSLKEAELAALDMVAMERQAYQHQVALLEENVQEGLAREAFLKEQLSVKDVDLKSTKMEATEMKKRLCNVEHVGAREAALLQQLSEAEAAAAAARAEAEDAKEKMGALLEGLEKRASTISSDKHKLEDEKTKTCEEMRLLEEQITILGGTWKTPQETVENEPLSEGEEIEQQGDSSNASKSAPLESEDVKHVKQKAKKIVKQLKHSKRKLEKSLEATQELLRNREAKLEDLDEKLKSLESSNSQIHEERNSLMNKLCMLEGQSAGASVREAMLKQELAESNAKLEAIKSEAEAKLRQVQVSLAPKESTVDSNINTNGASLEEKSQQGISEGSKQGLPRDLEASTSTPGAYENDGVMAETKETLLEHQQSNELDEESNGGQPSRAESPSDNSQETSSDSNSETRNSSSEDALKSLKKRAKKRINQLKESSRTFERDLEAARELLRKTEAKLQEVEGELHSLVKSRDQAAEDRDVLQRRLTALEGQSLGALVQQGTLKQELTRAKAQLEVVRAEAKYRYKELEENTMKLQDDLKQENLDLETQKMQAVLDRVIQRKRISILEEQLQERQERDGYCGESIDVVQRNLDDTASSATESEAETVFAIADFHIVNDAESPKISGLDKSITDKLKSEWELLERLEKQLEESLASEECRLEQDFSKWKEESSSPKVQKEGPINKEKERIMPMWNAAFHSQPRGRKRDRCPSLSPCRAKKRIRVVRDPTKTSLRLKSALRMRKKRGKRRRQAQPRTGTLQTIFEEEEDWTEEDLGMTKSEASNGIEGGTTTPFNAINGGYHGEEVTLEMFQGDGETISDNKDSGASSMDALFSNNDVSSLLRKLEWSRLILTNKLESNKTTLEQKEQQLQLITTKSSSSIQGGAHGSNDDNCCVVYNDKNADKANNLHLALISNHLDDDNLESFRPMVTTFAILAMAIWEVVW